LIVPFVGITLIDVWTRVNVQHIDRLILTSGDIAIYIATGEKRESQQSSGGWQIPVDRRAGDRHRLISSPRRALG
jgi:hypothetical protein